MIEIAIVGVTALHTVEDSTLAESSTGNTRLADRLLTEICRFFMAGFYGCILILGFGDGVYALRTQIP
ncbi:MAG TPA: hypothetical protein V6C84_21920 [Coleofasciculaceae cyanobacterium]|jgi:hypothetical protein